MRANSLARSAGRGAKAAAVRTWRRPAARSVEARLQHLPASTPASRASSKWKICDVVIVGAGPTGLACGIELKRRGLNAILIDKGCVVNSLYNYPTNLVFFTTPELLEIGDIPMTSLNEKPVRGEALKYYRRVANHYGLDIRQYQRVTKITGEDGAFVANTSMPKEMPQQYSAKKVILATGYYDVPNLLGCPGRGTAEGPALLQGAASLLRSGHADRRREEFGGDRGAGAVVVRRAGDDGPSWRGDSQEREVLAEAEYRESDQEWRHPDALAFAGAGDPARCCAAGDARWGERNQERLGVRDDRLSTGYRVPGRARHPLRSGDEASAHDPETLESDRKGMYLAGVIVAGMHTHEIFIENGRFHGKQIAEAIAQELQ